jgi:hypothetical protein
MTLAVHLQNASMIFPVHSHVDFMCVGGWYRVGKFLSSGGSGESNPGLSLIKLSELSRECLSRERHQD